MEYLNYIGGEWVPGRSRRNFDTINPANEEVLAKVSAADTEDLDEAVRTGQDAYRSWRMTPAPIRGEILYRVGGLLKERKEVLARLMTQEMGKVISEARGDVQEAIDMAFYMAGEGRRMLGYTAPVEMRDKFGMAVRDPTGVVGLITPWNFPIAVPSWKLFPALIAGNTVIWKPSPETPAISAEFISVFEQAGLPPGVLSVLLSPGVETGKALVSHTDVRVISFTGSTQVGRKIAQEAAKLNKKVSLEMGGKNAILVLDDANIDLAVDAIIWAAYGTTGQRCTAASRLIVQNGIAPQLKEAVIARARHLKLGDGLDEEVDVGPVVNQDALEKVDDYVKIGKQEGARLLIGGKKAEFEQGFFYEPTLFDGVMPEMVLAKEEIFGPVLSVIEVDNLDEAIQINNQVDYGLTTSIFTENVNRAFQSMRDIATGIVYINHGTTGAEIQFPFGGTRGTGNGHREAGQTALDIFTEWKTIYVDYSGQLQRAQIDTERQD